MKRVVLGFQGGWARSIGLTAALVHCGGDMNLATRGPDESLQGPESAGASSDESAPTKPSTAGGSDGSGGVQDKAQVDAADGAGGSSLSTSGPPGAGGTMGNPTDAGSETLVEHDAGSGMSLAPPGDVEWDPWPAVDPVAADTCGVSWFFGGDAISPPTPLANEIWTYNASVRVLTRQHAAVEGSSAWTGYIRIDSQRRREMVCHSARPPSSPFVCEEWVRDASGNAISDSFYAVEEGPLDGSVLDPAHPRKQAAIAGGESTRYTHKYDEFMELQSTVSYFPGTSWLTFSRDMQGRCSDVLWQVREDQNPSGTALEEVDHWVYQGDRLTSRVITNTKDAKEVRGVITYSYDAEGTLAATVVDGALDFPQPSPVEKPARDGLADYIVRTKKQPDGGRWIEVLRFTTDGKARITRNGTMASANRWRYFLSPGCAALPLPVHTSQDCEYERPTSMMPLGWNNPYVTPVPIGTPSPLPD